VLEGWDWSNSGPALTEHPVGEPGFFEGLIPFWGNGRSLVQHIQTGQYGRIVFGDAPGLFLDVVGWGAWSTAWARG
jgi:hypothetical protein